MALNLADLFEAVVDVVPDRDAIVCGDERVTFAELDRAANRFGHWLVEAGVRPGEHVAIHLRNGIEYVQCVLGALKARAVPININYRYTSDELAYLYDNSESVVVVVGADFLPAALEARDRAPGVRSVLTVGAEGSDAAASVHPFETQVAHCAGEREFGQRSEDDHFVVYTGGTTGLPKGVVWRHEDFYFAALGGGSFTGPPLRDEGALADAVAGSTFAMSYLVTAPLMHGAALYSLFAGFFSGSLQVLMPTFEPVEALRLVEAERIGCVMVVGDAIAGPLADAIDEHHDHFDLSSLFMVGSGGALWSDAVRTRLRRHLPQLYLRDGFGASESGVDGVLETGEDGRPRIEASEAMLLVDEEHRPIPPGSSEVGLLARTGHVPLGYHNDPVRSAETFPTIDGRRSAVLGDMAHWDGEDRFVVLGRGSVCIDTGGEKVFVEEVEAALKGHPAVFDAVVAGAPDDRYGERVCAVIALRDPAAVIDEAELTEHCRGGLAGYKVPRSFVVVPEIVRSPSGKADYRWARATVAES
ncbi:acyl-CoA synthetase [Rhodococcus rhodnii]|uniref:Acyl-CoA synthetase n=2 Tax=Rhodococcus rhodnii TaxID=38312 RepID=R7WQA7_9NOCA|nr:acyl-CoA synthetase [Rhodococcus rhodnii]EOM77488.1 acyl-CoA synthetase [Rhodococcus rhodnii LMG 5362]TXG90359.1 acyl-CoA synthetase [Rhodococcus rhodnii]